MISYNLGNQDTIKRTYTVCHNTAGCLSHSYVTASNIFAAIAQAGELYDATRNVQPLNKGL